MHKSTQRPTAAASTTPYADRNPYEYYTALGRMNRMIAEATAAGDVERAARLRISLLSYRLSANSTYGAPRRARDLR